MKTKIVCLVSLVHISITSSQIHLAKNVLRYQHIIRSSNLYHYLIIIVKISVFFLYPIVDTINYFKNVLL